MNHLLNKIRTESWAKNARVVKEPNTVFGRKIVPGIYFVKDSVTILGSGLTEDAAIQDAFNGVFKNKNNEI